MSRLLPPVLLGRETEAKLTLLRLRINENVVSKEMEEYKEKNAAFLTTNKIKAITQPEILKKLAIVCTVFFVQVFSGEIPKHSSYWSNVGK